MAAGISISTAIMATSFGLRVNHFAIFSSMADQSFPPNRPVMAAQKSFNMWFKGTRSFSPPHIFPKY